MSDSTIEVEPPLKKKKVLGLSDDGLKKLERLVFGTGNEILDDVKSDESESEDDNETVIHPKPAWNDPDCLDISFKEAAEKQGRVGKIHGESTKFNKVLSNRFEAVYGTPKWAEISKKDKNEPDILKRSGSLLKKPKGLQKGELDIKHLLHLNHETHYEGVIIKVIKFHPQSTVAMVGGLAGILTLFQVDGNENTKLQSIQFERYPIHCAEYLKNGEEIIVGSSQHKYYYTHNLMTGQSVKVYNNEAVEVTNMKKFVVSSDQQLIAVCGKFGFIYLLSAISKEYIGSFKTNDDVLALSFSSDNKTLYSHTSMGVVYIWDVKSRQLISKFYDDGCLQGTAINVSNNNQYLACGSSSGIVNIYDVNKLTEGSPRPIKIINNLVTSVTSLKFNHSSEILSMSSDVKDNAVKLVHFPSMTVFHNFPNQQKTYSKVQCSDFSANSGFYSIGNNAGSAYLFRLKYFGNY